MISDSQYRKAATLLNVDEAAIRAVVEVPITPAMLGENPFAAGLALGRGEAVSVNVPLIIHRRAQ